MRKTARRLRILLLSSPSEVCKFCSIDGGYQLSVAKIVGPKARIAALTGINAIICLLVAGSTPSQIRDIRISSELETTRVLIELNASFHYKVGRLTNPDKVYIDFAETAIGPTVRCQIQAGNRLVSQVRVGQPQKSSTRVVLDLYPGVRHRIESFVDPPRLEIELSGTMNPATPTVAFPPVPSAPVATHDAGRELEIASAQLPSESTPTHIPLPRQTEKQTLPTNVAV